MNCKPLLRIVPIALASLVIGQSGCSQLPSMNTAEIAPEKAEAGELRVQADAGTKTLSDGKIAAPKAEVLLASVRQLLAQDRAHSARGYVQQRPDMALETLRLSLGQSDDPKTLAAIAAAYDEQLGLNGENSWRHLIAAPSPEPVRKYAEARRHFHDAIRQGISPTKALAELADSAAAVGSPHLALDHLELCGIAALLAERPDQAAAHFAAACQLAGGTDPYQQMQMELLLSDALRRAKESERANRVWIESVGHAGELARKANLVDPTYWDRASYLRPASEPWPTEAVTPLAAWARFRLPTNSDHHDPGQAEAVVWGAIAYGHLQRRDHQDALLAAKRAEVATTSEELDGWLRLAQAEALACLDQQSAATAILVGLTTSADKGIAAAATATLGGLKLRAGDSNTGFRLLASAMNQHTLPAWRGRGNVEADLGLAYLMRSDEQNGLRWLHAAQDRFRQEGDVAALSQSLWNEAAYLKHSKQPGAEGEIRHRLASLENNPALQLR